MMKHLKQLLLLLCVMASSMCGNLSAQTFTASPAPVGGKFVAGTKWYTIKNVTNGGTGFLATSGTNYVDNSGNLLLANATAPTTDAGYWCVVQSGDNYVFYNRAAGANKVLGIYYNPSDVQSEGKNSYAKMYDAGTTETNIVKAFAKEDRTASENSKQGNFFYLPGNTDAYLNKHGQNTPARLAIWENGNAYKDDGSCFYFTHVMDEPAKITDDVQLSNAPVDGEWAANTKWYTIKNGHGNYLSGSYVKSGTDHLWLNTNSYPDLNGYWCVVGDETNGYSFYNYQTKQILEMTAESTSESDSYGKLCDPSNIDTDFETKFEFTQSGKGSGWWCIKVKDSEQTYLTQHGNKNYNSYNCLSYWKDMQAVWGWGKNESTKTGDDGSAFKFEAATINGIDVTLHYDAGNGFEFDRVKRIPEGTSVTLADVNNITYFKDFAFNTENLTVSENNNEFTVTCKPNFPFTEGHVYKMYGANSTGSLNSNASNFCFTARTEDNYITYKGDKAAVNAYSYWIFEHVDGTQDQFYVYNMGTGKYLSSNIQRQYAVMNEKGTGTANQIFRITPNGTGFNLQHQDDTYCCGMHFDGGLTTDKTYLGTGWGDQEDPSRAASRVYVMDIAPELAALGSNPVTEGTYVGETTSPRLISTAAAAGETPTKANVVACLDAKDHPTLADYVAADKYYQIFFVSSDNTTNKALTLKNATQNYNSGDGSFSLEISNTAMAVAPVAEASLSQTDFIASLYTLTAGTTGMTVTNVNANVPWGAVNITNSLLATTGEGTEYPFAVVSGQSDNSRWNIRTGNGYLAFNSADYENAIVNNTTSGTTARLKEVTSIPVTIKDTRWTSLCFPVDVVIPAELKVYKAASTQGMTINLEELAAGRRIPAGTGFLALAEAGGNYSFAIATGSELEADISGNQFTAATVKRSGMAGVDYFALATKNAVTGFYKVTTGTVPANKAYLLGEKLNQGAGANMLQFAFGEGTETGISNVNAENSGKAETYYDLNGRLVVYPTRGVYVTGSGRKVFVK